jgi:murein DD-endopeptidase MepM/ murein hydrolase activator NlpD
MDYYFCKMENEELVARLRSNQKIFQPVVPFDPDKDRLEGFDLSENGKQFPDELFNDTKAFTDLVNRKLANAGARYGIGGYGELRSIYRMSNVFDDDENTSEEPRRFHLGIDLWGKPYTPVSAPLTGIVHSFGYNDGIGDYGVTVILSHPLEGLHFYTLYGHLSLNSIKNMNEGERVKAGDIFAEFGIPAENGHWPPHLHFQLIADLQGWKGDYPGVCKYSEREKYLDNCPDPDIILQLSRHL